MASNSDVAVNPTIALIKQVLQKSPALKDQIAWDAWAEEQTILGEKVALFREYADGQHRAKLSTEMKQMLRIDPADDSSPFAINHMDNLIQTVADRLNLTGIKGSDDASTKWITGTPIGFPFSIHAAGSLSGPADFSALPSCTYFCTLSGQ